MSITLKDFTVSPHFSLKEVQPILKKFGAVLIPNWLSALELQNLNSEWYRVRELRDDASCQCVQRIGGDVADYAALYRNEPGAEQFESVNKIFSHPKIVTLLDKVVGRPNLLNQEVYATYDVGQSAEVAPSHFDKTWNMKCMIYLDDIFESGMGAFSVHPGSQHFAREQFRDWFRRFSKNHILKVGTPEYYEMCNQSLPDALSDCVEIHAPAGSLIIFSTDVYHRGSMLNKGCERRIFRGHTQPGYKMLAGGDLIRKQSRHWQRGEAWEVKNKSYSRLSVDGLLEWKDYTFKKTA